MVLLEKYVIIYVDKKISLHELLNEYNIKMLHKYVLLEKDDGMIHF